jgi:hypothetical protein
LRRAAATKSLSRDLSDILERSLAPQTEASA